MAWARVSSRTSGNAAGYPFSSYDDPEVVGVSATYKFRYERGTLALIGAEVTAGSEEHRHHGSMASTSKSRLARIASIGGRAGTGAVVCRSHLVQEIERREPS